MLSHRLVCFSSKKGSVALAIRALPCLFDRQALPYASKAVAFSYQENEK